MCTKLVSKESKLATCLANQWLSAVQLWGAHCRVLIWGSSRHLRFCRVPCISFRQIVLLFWCIGYCFEAEKNNFRSWTPPHSSLHLLRCHLPVHPEVIPFVTTGWTRRRKWWHSVTNDISFWWAECRVSTTPFGRMISDMWADYVSAWLFYSQPSCTFSALWNTCLLQPACRALPPPHHTSSHFLSSKRFGLVDLPYGSKEDCSSRHKGEASNVMSPAVA